MGSSNPVPNSSALKSSRRLSCARNRLRVRHTLSPHTTSKGSLGAWETVGLGGGTWDQATNNQNGLSANSRTLQLLRKKTALQREALRNERWTGDTIPIDAEALVMQDKQVGRFKWDIAAVISEAIR